MMSTIETPMDLFRAYFYIEQILTCTLGRNIEIYFDHHRVCNNHINFDLRSPKGETRKRNGTTPEGEWRGEEGEQGSQEGYQGTSGLD
ncbi:hypothetical protein NHQ30_008159 [Ciborinia camelliae]|nr:hypothetical protein NHQ30_008159 [Ciborinia camelliae]